MFYIIIILIYISGFIICLGIATWFDYHTALPYIKNLQSDYKRAIDNPYALFVSSLSWIGVIVMCAFSTLKFKKIGIKYSYKELWKRWDNNHNH